VRGRWGGLAGRRILVVEDVFLVADVIRDNLEDNGCIVVGPVPRLPEAMALARNETLDAAVLDVNLAGEMSFAVSSMLRDRGVPYVYLTGYDDDEMFPDAERATPRLAKPFQYTEFMDFVAVHLGPR